MIDESFKKNSRKENNNTCERYFKESDIGFTIKYSYNSPAVF